MAPTGTPQARPPNNETNPKVGLAILIGFVVIVGSAIWGMSDPLGWSPLRVFDPKPEPVQVIDPAVVAARDAQRQAGYDYGFELGRSVRGQIGQPKDWAMEPLAKLHLEKAVGVADAVVWKEGFKRGYIAGLR